METIKSYVEKGKYVVVKVEGTSIGQHWVAVRTATDESVVIMDPSSKATDLFATYKDIKALRIFEIISEK